ncbi:MAG: sigma-70 family RNA polymerase sigma factor, partial [Verrucomicrobiota bacterium]
NPLNLIPTRASLLVRLKNCEDQESWDEFYDIYSDLIFRVALLAGLSHTEAQEVLQETMIRLAKQMQSFEYDPTRSFKGWLVHEANYRIKDQFRKRHPERQAAGRRAGDTSRTATIDRIPDPAGFKVDDVWEKEWQTNLLNKAIERVKSQVTARQFQMFDLYVTKQWPVQKVAKVLGVNIARVYLAKHRVSVLIKSEIKKLEKKESEWQV